MTIYMQTKIRIQKEIEAQYADWQKRAKEAVRAQRALLRWNRANRCANPTDEQRAEAEKKHAEFLAAQDVVREWNYFFEEETYKCLSAALRK